MRGVPVCHLRKSIRSPDHRLKMTNRMDTASIGSSKSNIARTKLSKRKPRSRRVSFRTRCEKNMKANASATGTATISLLNSATADRIHSAIRIDETTDTISQAARAGSPMTVTDRWFVCFLLYSLELKVGLPERRFPRSESAEALQSIAKSVALRHDSHGRHKLEPHARQLATEGF